MLARAVACKRSPCVIGAHHLVILDGGILPERKTGSHMKRWFFQAD